MRKWLWVGIVGAVLAAILIPCYVLYCPQAIAAAGTLFLGWATLMLALVTVQLARYADAGTRAQFRPVVVLRRTGDWLFPYNVGAGAALNIEVLAAEVALKGAAAPEQLADAEWSGSLLLGTGEGEPDIARFNCEKTASGTPIPYKAQGVLTQGRIELAYYDVFGRRFETVLAAGQMHHREM